MPISGLLLEACYTRYVLFRDEAVRQALLAPATPHGDAERALADCRARMAHGQMLGAIRRHEDATGVDIRGGLLAAVERQVVMAEAIARDEAVRTLKLIESLNRSAA